MSLKVTDRHSSIEGYTIDVYKRFGVNSPDDLDLSRRPILNLIDHMGKVIDLGSGCGWFLKYLVENSIHNLDPYGIDIEPESIREAKEIVFPEYADNFEVADIEEYALFGNFDYIIVNPLYVGLEFPMIFEHYWNHLNPHGKLILMITNDTLVRMIDWKGLWDFLRHRNLKWYQTNPLTIGYITKHGVTVDKQLNSPVSIKDLLSI